MEPTPFFSIDVPRVGEEIDVVAFASDTILACGPFASVKGPFRIDRHDAYECKLGSGADVVIYRLQPGDRMDPEAEKIFSLLTFLR
jgi:hypothetical protein